MNSIVFYDEAYLAPGVFVAVKENGEIIKFFKLYEMSNEQMMLGIRAFAVNAKDNIDIPFTPIKFTFSKDNDESLFKIFKEIMNINNKEVGSINYDHGSNNLKMNITDEEVSITFHKDIWCRECNTGFCDIYLGDALTCPYYEEFLYFYQELKRISLENSREVNNILSLNRKVK